MSSYNKPFITTIVILLVVIIGFVVFYLNTSGRISDNQTSLAALKTQTDLQIASLKNQLSTDETQLTAISSQLTAANTQITNLNSQLTAATGQINSQSTSVSSQITSLNNQLTAATGQITSLKGQLATDETQISSLSGQVSPLNQQITAATSKITDLQNQLTSANSLITTLQNQVSSLSGQIGSGSGSGSGQQTLFSGQVFSIPAGQQIAIGSFVSTSSGNLFISGSITTSTGYVRLNNSVTGSTTNYPFNGSSITIPVPPSGNNIIYLGDTDAPGNPATATLTGYVTFSGSGTYQTSIISSQYFSVPAQQQTIVASFVASYTGNIYVSGTTTSTASYIKVYNSVSGYTNNYPFNNAYTTIVPVQAGSNQIYLGNTDAVNSTATLSITFSH